MAIDFQHKDYKANIEKWQKIDRFMSGDGVREADLPDLHFKTDPDSNKRNARYKDGATFYFISSFTLRGMIGLLFSKWPTFNVPKQLEYLKTNCDGAGTSIYQQAQKTGKEVTGKGRAGLLVSYPETQGAVSRADMEEMRVFATIHKIDAEQIINWRYILDGAQVKLSLLVYYEVVEEYKDYENLEVQQICELSLDGGVFVIRKWRLNEKKEWYIHSESIPTNGKGENWNIIHFQFCGSNDNTASVDDAPMYPFVEIEDRLFRNSASHEHNLFWTAFTQWWISGLNKNHIDEMKENNIEIGGPALIGVPAGERLGTETAPYATGIRQGIIDKVEMLVGLGDRFIQRTGPAKTATQAAGDQSVQHSQLSMISSNLSEAYTQCIKWVAEYMNVPVTDDMEFKTTQDFVSPTATAQDIQAMVAGFVQGAMPASAYFAWLKKHGLEDSEKTIEEFMEEVNTEPMTDLDSEVV